MGRFIFDITDEQRSKLETVRAAGGFRSGADALRDLIDRAISIAPMQPEEARPITIGPALSFAEIARGTPVARSWDGSPIPERKPYQKGQKK